MTFSKPTHLSPSELGTKEYWDNTYTEDITTHTQTPSHTGQDWFSDVNASSKILRYLTSASIDLDKNTTSFLDLGTGNGEMLFMLREEGGFEGEIIGVDYSASSVALCRKRMEGLSEEDPDIKEIRFEELDIMHSNPFEDWRERFDVVLDKGTFDAISLSDEVDGNGKRLFEGYRAKVEVLIKKGGYVVVTSCNWTENELKEWFEGGRLKAVGRIEYPTFKFGGKTGQSISTVCFEKKN